MHSITIVFGPTGTSWRFLFKSAARAETTYSNIMAITAHPDVPLRTDESRLGIVDDFGQRGIIPVDQFVGAMLEDLDQTKLAAIEMSVHNGRAQADAEQAMRADPKIMASARGRQGGPPILAPMGNGFTR